MYKKYIYISFMIFCSVIFVGCKKNTPSADAQNLNSSDTIESTFTPTKPISSSANSNFTLLGSSPTGEKFYQNDNDTNFAFIDTKTGWKTVYSNGDTNQQNVTLYKTINGGDNWDKITSTFDKSYTIPLETKTGITFLNDNFGWITTTTPKEGSIELFNTTDGGYTWNKSKMKVPNNYSTFLFHTYPPTFFSESDGILLNDIYRDINEKKDPLVFITNDKGKSWIRLTPNCIKLNIKWSYSSEKETGTIWNVTYKKQSWQSKDGLTWNKVN